jgi:hypothetical protein
MGLKLRGVLRCGACGKPRGLGTHLCSPGRRRRRRTRPQNPVTWECPSCRKPRGLRHTCGNRGDFKARRRKHATAERQRKRKAVRARQAARRRQTAAERRARERTRQAEARKRKRRPSRPRGDSHEPGTCGDHKCPRARCQAYWEGMADCPGPHGSEGG